MFSDLSHIAKIQVMSQMLTYPVNYHRLITDTFASSEEPTDVHLMHKQHLADRDYKNRHGVRDQTPRKLSKLCIELRS